MNSSDHACTRRAGGLPATLIAAFALSFGTPAWTQELTDLFFFKSFSPDTIGPGSVSTLTFQINSESPQPETDLAFTDILPAALTIAAPAFVTNTCGGTLTAPEGGSTITLTDGSVGALASCQISVDVTGTTIGAHQNVSDDLTSSAGNSGPAVATLTIAADRPGFTKSFSPDMVQFGSTARLTFTIDNTANGALESGLAFSDDLPAGLQIADPANASNTCNGTLTAPAGGTTISLFGGFVTANTSCTIGVDVTATAVGHLDNRTSDLTLGFGENSGKASDSLTVVIDEVALVKSFIDDPVFPGGTTTLQFSITNVNRSDTATAITFTDDLDATLSGLVAVPPLPTDPCGAGSSLTGTSLLTLAGGNLAPGESCTFDVTLQVPAGASPGSFPNTTSDITGNLGGEPVTGAGASDTLFVDIFPVLTKTFLDSATGSGGTADVEFTITNTSSGFGATDISYFDNLSDFLPGTTPVGLPMPACGGTLVQANNFPITDAVSLFLGSGFGSTPGSLGPGASCTFTVTLQLDPGAPDGTHTNTTSEITATVDGATRTGPAASDTLDVAGAPRLLKQFTDDPVDPGNTVTLDFNLSHSELAPGDATDIAFTDDLNAALTGLSAIGLPQNDVCGAGSQLAGNPDASSLSFTGGTLAPGESCTVSVTLQVPPDAPPGFRTNTTSAVTATVDGLATTGNAASDDLLISGVELAKQFIGDPVLPGATLPLRFTIANDNPDFDATDISFSDDLAAALPGLAATGLPQNDVCGMGSSISGTTSLSFTGGSLAAGTSCTFDVTVQVPAGAESATYNNTTSPVVATMNSQVIQFGNAQDNLVVDANLLELSKSFTDDPGIPGGTVTLVFTVANVSATEAVTDISFTDDLDAALSGLVSESGIQADVCGAGSQLAGTSLLTLTGGNLAAGASCTFSATLRIPADASSNGFNTTSQPTGSAGGLAVEGAPASDTLEINRVAFSKAFDGPTVPGGTVILSFTIENLDAANPVSGLSFTDNLNAVVVGLAASGTVQSGICGAASKLSGATQLTFTGGELAAAASCTFDVTLQVPASATPGSFVNTTSELLANGLTAANPATAALQVAPNTPPAFSKAFAPDDLPASNVTRLTFTINNTASEVAATSLAFSDPLPAGIEVAASPNAANTCGGTLSAAAGANTIDFSGGSVGAGATCTIAVDLLADTAGSFTNTTGALTSSLGSSGTASATITVRGAPGFSKVFAPASIGAGETSMLTFTIDNSAESVSADSLDFTDNLPAGVEVAAAPAASTTCTGGTLTATAGSNTVAYTGGSAAAGSTCTVSVDVAGTAVGTHVNTAGNLTSSLGNSGTATATLEVGEDSDGIPASVEDQAPNNGDGNSDGTPDGAQDDVASLPTFDDTSFITLELTTGCAEFNNVIALDPASQAPPPEGTAFPFGLIGFEMPCETATVDVIFHGAGTNVGDSYLKFGPTVPGDAGTADWFDLAAQPAGSPSGATASGNVWTLTLADNALGDATGDDGTIVDPGGPAATIAGGDQIPVPLFDIRGLALLTLLLAAIAWHALGAPRP